MISPDLKSEQLLSKFMQVEPSGNVPRVFERFVRRRTLEVLQLPDSFRRRDRAVLSTGEISRFFDLSDLTKYHPLGILGKTKVNTFPDVRLLLMAREGEISGVSIDCVVKKEGAPVLRSVGFYDLGWRVQSLSGSDLSIVFVHEYKVDPGPSNAPSIWFADVIESLRELGRQHFIPRGGYPEGRRIKVVEQKAKKTAWKLILG